jgi:hypothetical protein
MMPSPVLCQKPHPSPFWPDSYIPNTCIPSTTIILSTTVPSAIINHPKAYYHHLKHCTFLSSMSFVFAETIPSYKYLFHTNQKSCSPLFTKFIANFHHQNIFSTGFTINHQPNIIAHSWILDQLNKDIHQV